MKAEGRLLLGRDDDLSGMDAGQLVLQLLSGRKLRDFEVAGGEIDQREAKFPGFGADPGDKVVAVRMENVGVKMRAGGQDLGDLALDEFAGLGVAELVTDCNFFAEPEQFADVAFGGVVREAAHRGAVAGSQGEIEQAGRRLGVVKKHFVEITEPKQQ